MEKEPITTQGLKKLQEELEDLKNNKRPDTDISAEGFSAAYVAGLHTWLSEIGVDIKRLYRSGDSELGKN